MPVPALGVLAAAGLLTVLVALDLFRVLRLVNPVVIALTLPLILNAPLAAWHADRELGGSWRWTLIVLGVLLGYVWLCLQLIPFRSRTPVGARTTILAGSAPLLYSLCFATMLEAVLLPLSLTRWRAGAPTELLVTNLIWALCCIGLLFLNGTLRAVLLSKSLSLLGRAILFCTAWIPVLGWFPAAVVGRAVRREYTAVVDRVEWERALPQDGLCATKYPILLVHGVGWRDLKLHNAWGRIPKYLKLHGASVFHGEQEAWGTIESNGEHLAERIEQVLELSGAEKLNIIAHSRGGIDSRYTISSLGMGDRVASLTTMNTPHHGVRFADTATKLKEPVYLKLAAVVNFLFGVVGDKTPDFMASTMAFRTELAREFNRANPDHAGVFYQSYTSVMSSAGSHRVLSVPYRVIKALGDENDGLVTVDSAKWGEFRGVFRSTSRRGVSHGDLVDMDREDYAGFNVLDTYLKIVAELKERGF